MAFDTPRRLSRSARVASAGARIYIGYKRTQRSARKLSPEAAAVAWERRHEEVAERLYRLAIDLKGLYIKTGQFVGTRSDIVPAAYSRSLSRLQDQVPPRPVTVIRTTIEREFGRPVTSLFATFDDTPLAAASLAQVHRATLPGGREVVVKVQYPEVDALVRLDIRNLRTIIGLVARREPRFDYRAVVAEIGKQVPLELDFVREAEMTRRVRVNLAPLPGIVVPEVIDGLVTRRVLVTAYLPGRRLLGPVAAGESLATGAALARAITDAFGHQILVDGLFQADPHPGNLLVLPDGRVGLLDFGLTKELPDAVRLSFARLVIAAADRNPAAVLAAFAELGLRTGSDHPDDALALMHLFLGPPGAGRGSGAGFVSRDPEKLLDRSPLEAIPGDLILLGRVVGLLRGVCASLGSPLTPMQMLRPFAERALAEPLAAAGA
ncbi:MAG: AarF/ABC1/UbiB kinase family protein [Chloroflexi bacterium]|nr:AarF/ABC1/UbiB kinase family protein [Chloroflexota bacterium]